MKRRFNNEGSYYFNAKTGLWRFTIQYTNHGKTHRKALYSRDKAELKAKADRSERQIILAASTIDVLRKWREQQTLFAQKYYGIFQNKNNLVFTNIYGGFVNMTNFLHRFFSQMLKRANIKDFSFHGLRHTHASKLLEKGVDVQIVSHRLGHASVSTTMNIYAHLLPDAQELVRSKIDTIFERRTRDE